MPMDRVRSTPDLRTSLTNHERLDRSPGAIGQGSFRENLVKAQVGQLNDRIDKALQQVDQLGQRLGESLNLGDLRQYKQAIAALMRDLTSNMVQVRSEMEWDSQAWEHRTLVVIRTVDAELEKLTEMVVSQEQDRLSILAKIGEIKGMLLDLRM